VQTLVVQFICQLAHPQLVEISACFPSGAERQPVSRQLLPRCGQQVVASSHSYRSRIDGVLAGAETVAGDGSVLLTSGLGGSLVAGARLASEAATEGVWGGVQLVGVPGS